MGNILGLTLSLGPSAIAYGPLKKRIRTLKKNEIEEPAGIKSMKRSNEISCNREMIMIIIISKECFLFYCMALFVLYSFLKPMKLRNHWLMMPILYVLVRRCDLESSNQGTLYLLKSKNCEKWPEQNALF